MSVQPTYSTRLYAGTVSSSAGRLHLFTVPAGYRVVIRAITASLATGSGSQLIVRLSSTSAELFRVSNTLQTVMNPHEETRIVIHEGESIDAQAYVVNVALHMSGYLLSGAGAPLVPGQLPTLPSA